MITHANGDEDEVITNSWNMSGSLRRQTWDVKSHSATFEGIIDHNDRNMLDIISGKEIIVTLSARSLSIRQFCQIPEKNRKRNNNKKNDRRVLARLE
jgi:hypothetical protein